MMTIFILLAEYKIGLMTNTFTNWVLRVCENNSVLKSFAIGTTGADIQESDIFSNSSNSNVIFRLSPIDSSLLVVNCSSEDITINHVYEPDYLHPMGESTFIDVLPTGKEIACGDFAQYHVSMQWDKRPSVEFIIDKLDLDCKFIFQQSVISESGSSEILQTPSSVSAIVQEVVGNAAYQETLQSNKENLKMIDDKIDGLRWELGSILKDIENSINSPSSKEFFEHIRYIDDLIRYQILPRTDDETWRNVFNSLCYIRKGLIISYGLRGIEEYCPVHGDALDPLIHEIDGEIPTGLGYSDLSVGACIYSGFRDKDDKVVLRSLVTVAVRGL